MHDNNNIPDIQKLHYLKSCLNGEAAAVIGSIQSSSTNYRVAWDLLTDRYDNRRVIIESHTKALLEMPQVSKDFSIRALLDHVQKHIRALRALEQPVDQWDTILITVITSKSNYAIREKWEDSTSESSLPTMQQMLTFLQRRAQLEEMKPIQISNKPQSKNENKVKSHSFKKSVPQHAY